MSTARRYSQKDMDVFPDDEFMAWFFAFFTGDIVCPHCQSVIYQDEISEKGRDYVVCSYCQKKIRREDIEKQ